MNDLEEQAGTWLGKLFADYKVHHRSMNVCFNDAVAVAHLQREINLRFEQATDHLQGHPAKLDCDDIWYSPINPTREKGMRNENLL